MQIIIIRMFIKINFFFWPLHVAQGILVPQPGTELVLSAVEA